MADIILNDGIPVSYSDLDQMVLMLRTIIGDLDEEDYTDVKLKKILGAAANMVLGEMPYFSDYSMGDINTTTGEFTISPSTPAALSALIVMKAACLLSVSELRYNAAMSGFKAVCDRVSVSSSESSAVWNSLINKGYCAFFDELRKKVERSPMLDGSYFKAIVSTFAYRGSGGCQSIYDSR